MYTISLDGGKYTVFNDNGSLRFLRHGEAWPAVDILRHVGVTLAMAQRIEELEVAIGEVLNGRVIVTGCRDDSGMVSFDANGTVPFKDWEAQLRRVLEQK
jgi:hypothetical protein